jgi:hypothetical protein
MILVQRLFGILVVAIVVLLLLTLLVRLLLIDRRSRHLLVDVSNHRSKP